MNHQLSPQQETTPKIYSYRRVSSTKQLQGDGMEMQREVEKLKELSEQYGLPVHGETLDDFGLSAFKGDNTTRGSLGWFIDAVKAGYIMAGSILVVYSLDRFSRQKIANALNDFTELLRKNIRVYSVLESHMFESSLNNNESTMDITMAGLIFNRSHGESETKSKRAQHLLERAITRHQEGNRSPDGYAYSIKVAGNDVWWVDNSQGDVRQHPVYWDIAKDVCERLIMGESPYMIEKRLNDSSIKSPIKRIDKVIKGAWSIHMIRRIHENKALIGEKVINGIVLPNYYPPLLTEEEFYRLMETRNDRKRPKSKRKSIVSLFAGLPNVVCAHCGAGVHLNTEPKNKSYNYRCSGHHQCDSRGFVLNKSTYDSTTDDQLLKDIKPRRGWTKRANLIEQALLQVCVDKVWLPAKAEHQSKLPELQGRLTVLNKEYEALGSQAKEDGFPRFYAKQLAEYEQQIDLLMKEIESQRVIESAHKYTEPETLRARWADISSRVLDFNNTTARLQMRELIRDSFTMIAIGRPLGSDRFTLHMLIKFIDGESRIIAMGRNNIQMIGNIGNQERLPDSSLEYLSSIDAPMNLFMEPSKDKLETFESIVGYIFPDKKEGC